MNHHAWKKKKKIMKAKTYRVTESSEVFHIPAKRKTKLEK